MGIRPEMSVLEVWPEPGWYTEITGAAASGQGQGTTRRVIAPDPESEYITGRLDDFRRKLAAHPEIYGQVTVVTFPLDGWDVVPPGSLDMVLTFRNIHNWMAHDSPPRPSPPCTGP